MLGNRRAVRTIVLPDFIVIGAMKCATSTVSAYLETHPEIFMLPDQDPEFFSNDSQWSRGIDWYAGLFAEGQSARLRGEGSNNYTSDTLYPHAAERMAALCPHAKLIYIVRDPIARIVSHWVQSRADSRDDVPACPDRAVLEWPERFVAPSFYWRQLNRYRKHYPDHRIWIGFMEELEAHPERFFANLCTFLDVAPCPFVPIEHRNPSAEKRLPSPLYSRLRQLPGLRHAARQAPEGLRSWMRGQFTMPATEGPTLSAAVDAQLRAELADDTRQFLAHCGRPPDHWQPS